MLTAYIFIPIYLYIFIPKVKLILRRMEKSPINQTPTQISENPHRDSKDTLDNNYFTKTLKCSTVNMKNILIHNIT